MLQINLAPTYKDRHFETLTQCEILHNSIILAGSMGFLAKNQLIEELMNEWGYYPQLRVAPQRFFQLKRQILRLI